MRTVLLLGAAGLAAAGALVAAPALAGTAIPADGSPSTGGSTGTTLPEGSALHDRLERFCGRVPAVMERASEAQKRLAGDADTAGSLDRLEARVRAAEDDDLPRVTRRLEARLERRTERAERLPDRIDTLLDAQEECQSLGLAAK